MKAKRRYHTRLQNSPLICPIKFSPGATGRIIYCGISWCARQPISRIITAWQISKISASEIATEAGACSFSHRLIRCDRWIFRYFFEIPTQRWAKSWLLKSCVSRVYESIYAARTNSGRRARVNNSGTISTYVARILLCGKIKTLFIACAWRHKQNYECEWSARINNSCVTPAPAASIRPISLYLPFFSFSAFPTRTYIAARNII